LTHIPVFPQRRAPCLGRRGVERAALVEDDAVHRLRPLARHPALRHVVADTLGVALDRRAVAAAATGVRDERLPRLEAGARPRVELRQLARALALVLPARAARAAAARSERRIERPVRGPERLDLAADRPVLDERRRRAARAPGALGVRQDP